MKNPAKSLLLLFILFSMIQVRVFSRDEPVATRNVTLQLKWKHQFQFAGYYAAVEKGFYKDAGLNVTIVEADSSKDPVDAVINRTAEFGTGDAEILTKRFEGNKVVLLAVIFQHSPMVLVASKSSGIRYVHDLAGKRIAIEPNDADIKAMIFAEGMTMESMQRCQHLYDVSQLTRGDVDAMTAYFYDEPFLLKQAGFEYNVISPITSGIDFYGDLLFTSESLIKTDPELVEKFRKASLQGWKYAMAHEEEIIGIIYSKYSQRHSIDHLRYEAQQMKPLILPDVVEIGYYNPYRWEQMLKTYKRLEMINKSFTLKGFFREDYEKHEPQLPWRLILIFSAILAVVGSVSYYFYAISKKLKTEIRKRELIQTQFEDSVARDLRERKKAETEIRMKNEELLQLNAEKDKFLGILAHDLRSPFNGFLGLIGAMLKELPNMEKREIERLFREMESSAKDVFHLLENLLEWASVKQGMVSFNPQKIQVSKEISTIEGSVKSAFSQKEISLECKIPDDLMVVADKNMVAAILRNLLSNALKFTPRGGTVRITAKRIPDDQVELAVSDTGIGMTPAERERVFNLSEKTYRKGTEEESSSGLGLIIVKEFVDQNKGTIRVESEVKHGTTFYVTLPEPAHSRIPTGDPQNPILTDPGKNKHH